MTNSQQNHESNYIYDDEISLHDIVRVLYKRRKLILSIFLAVVMLSLAYAFLTPPVYEVTATISLGNYNSNLYTNPDVVVSILSGDEFLQKVAKGTGINVQGNAWSSFKRNVSVEKCICYNKN